jgi:hypothetical protein
MIVSFQILVFTLPMAIANRSKWPTTLLYPTEWLPVANEAQQCMIDAFLAALESYLGLKHQKISLQQLWAQTGPRTLRHKTLLDIVKVSMPQPFPDIPRHPRYDLTR